jgi:hypothetical protein
MFAYFFFQLLVFVHGKHWDLLNTPMGYWYLLEMFGFVFLPMSLFFYSYRRHNILLVKVAAVLTMLGVIMNRAGYTKSVLQGGWKKQTLITWRMKH